MQLKIQSTRRGAIIASRLRLYLGKWMSPTTSYVIFPFFYLAIRAAKVEKNNRRKLVRQNSGPRRRVMVAPYMGVPCYYCNRPGHIEINCFKRRRDLGGPSVFSRRTPQLSVNTNQNTYREITVQSLSSL